MTVKVKRLTDNSAFLLALCVGYWPCSNNGEPLTFYHSSSKDDSSGCPTIWQAQLDLQFWTPRYHDSSMLCSWCNAEWGHSAAVAGSPKVIFHLQSSYNVWVYTSVLTFALNYSSEKLCILISHYCLKKC